MSLFLRLWRNARRASEARRATRKQCPRACFRPHLEPLEERLAPATHVWQGAFSSSWSDARNWIEGGSPAGDPDATLIFPASNVARLTSTNDLPGTTTIWAIGLQRDGYTLNGNPIEVTRAISDSSRSGSNTLDFSRIDVRNVLLTNPEFVVFAGATLEVRSPVGEVGVIGARLLHKTEGGRLVLSGDNTFASGMAVLEGTLVAGSKTALGPGTLVLAGGTLEASGGDPNKPIPIANRFTVTRSSTVAAVGKLFFLSGDGQIFKDQTLHVVANDGGGGDSGFVSFNGRLFGQGGLTKAGVGRTLVSGGSEPNTYEGGTVLLEGVLLTIGNNALGTGRLVLSGGELGGLYDGTTLSNRFEVRGSTTLRINSASTDPDEGLTLSGPGTIFAGATLTVEGPVADLADPSAVTLSGPLSGPGGLTTKGTTRTTVTLSGTAANTYTGTTRVNSGTLVLQKPAGVNAVAGPLVIGDGVGAARSAVVSLAAANQIADTAPVTVNADGLLRMNNFSEKFGPLTNRGKVSTADPPTLTVAFDEVTATFEGEIDGPGLVVKGGTGTWILTGANTYEGGTFVEGGTLLVDGSLIGPVSVSAGATLGGSGTTGPVTLAPGAAVSPGGTSPGIQTVQDLAFSAGSSFAVQLDGPDPGTGYDQLDVTGSVSLNGATLDASLGFSPDPGQRFVVIDNDGTDPVAGTFAGLPQGAALLIGGVPFHIYYGGGDGNDVELVRNAPPAVAVPGDQTAFQNVELAIGGVRVGDPDDASLTILLQVSHGTLTLDTIAGLTVVGNGTAAVSLSGSQAALNAALASLLYRPGHNYSGPDALAVTVSDGLDTTSVTVAIRVKSLAEQAAELQARVDALAAAGVLNQGQANSLEVKLELQGGEGDVGRVQAFLHEVAALLSGGILSPAQADSLSGPGNVLLLGLRRR